MPYIVANMELVFEDEYVVKSMLATGEYGIHGHPITHDAMVEFVKNRAFGIEHHNFLRSDEQPLYLSVKDEDGEDLWYWSNRVEMAEVYDNKD